MQTAASRAPDATQGQHLLKSTPETVHWGFFDAELKPVLTIDPDLDDAARQALREMISWSWKGKRIPPKSTG